MLNAEFFITTVFDAGADAESNNRGVSVDYQLAATFLIQNSITLTQRVFTLIFDEVKYRINESL